MPSRQGMCQNKSGYVLIGCKTNSDKLRQHKIGSMTLIELAQKNETSRHCLVSEILPSYHQFDDHVIKEYIL